MALTAAGASSPGSSARLAASCRTGSASGCASSCGHRLGEPQQPGGLDADSLADQPAFRQHGAQPIGSLAIAAIDGRKRGKCCGIHEERCLESMLLDWPRMISQDRGSRKEHDSFGEIEVPAGCAVGCADRTRAAQLPAQRHDAAGGFHRRAGADQGGRGARQCPAGPAAGRRGRGHRRGGARRGARRARRAVSARRLPDRQRHQHQHECQRGDRAPRERSAWAGRCMPTITSTCARAAMTAFRARST